MASKHNEILRASPVHDRALKENIEIIERSYKEYYEHSKAVYLCIGFRSRSRVWKESIHIDNAVRWCNDAAVLLKQAIGPKSIECLTALGVVVCCVRPVSIIDQ